MDTDQPADQRTALTEPTDSAIVGNEGLFCQVMAAVLFVLVGLHATQRDALWTTENVLLLMTAAVGGSWLCRPRDALLLAFTACLGWWVIDLSREPSFIACSARHLIRMVLVLSLVLLGTRVRQRLVRAERNARVDALTELPNRRAIISILEAELSRLKRVNRPFSIAMIDCDGFKAINDEQGHQAGDRLLQLLAAGFRKYLRVYDSVGRLGGDEFVLILPETTSADVPCIIERLRSQIDAELREEFPSFTLSIGVVTITAQADKEAPLPKLEECLHEADQAMYAAKRSGAGQTGYAVCGAAAGRER